MQFKSTLILASAALAFVSSVAAAPYPESVYEGYEAMFRRNGMTCKNHNNQVMCSTTHHCVGGHVEWIPGTYTGNDFCTKACSCR